MFEIRCSAWKKKASKSTLKDSFPGIADAESGSSDVCFEEQQPDPSLRDLVLVPLPVISCPSVFDGGSTLFLGSSCMDLTPVQIKLVSAFAFT